MVEPVGKENKARIDERSNVKDDGKGSEEDCDFGRDDEVFPLPPLNKFMNSCKLLPFPASSMTGTGESISSCSSELVKSIVEAGNDETLTFNSLSVFSSIFVCSDWDLSATVVT